MEILSLIILRTDVAKDLLLMGLNYSAMATGMMCDCGWTIISPKGEMDVKKHAMMHVQDAHPGMKITDEQMMKMMKRM